MAVTAVHYDPPKLPVVSLVKESISHVWRNLRLAFTMQRRWLMQLLPFVFAMTAMPYLLLPAFEKDPVSMALFAMIIGPVNFGMAVAILIYTASINVGWIRFALLDEVPDRRFMSLDRDVWRYIGYALLLTLLVVCIVGAAFLMTQYAGTMAGQDRITAFLLGAVGGAVGGLVAIAISARLAFALVEAAIGRNVSFGLAWQMTRGNAMRLFGATLLIILTVVVATLVIAAVPFAVGLMLPSLIKVLQPYGFAGWMLIGLIVASIQVIQIPIQTALTLVSASFLAFAYRFFERR